MDIQKNRWRLPSVDDGTAWMVRSTKAEEHLRESLDMLMHVINSIPHRPAGETKTQIESFLTKFK